MREIVKTQAIVARAVNVSEYDKMLTLISREYGKISVSAKGVRSLKNKNSSLTSPFCYGEFVLNKGHSVYTLKEGEIIQNFYKLRQSVDALAYGTYFTALVSSVVQENQNASNELKLLLNTLHFLAEDEKRANILKVVLELRLAMICGITPDVFDSDEEEIYFNAETSSLQKEKNKNTILLETEELKILRYILSEPLKNALTFNAKKEYVDKINTLTEKYLALHLGRLPKSLDYLKNTVMTL